MLLIKLSSFQNEENVATCSIYFFLSICLFVFLGVVTLSIKRTKKLLCRRNTTSQFYNIKYKYRHKIIVSGAGKKKKKHVQISRK